jgi:hypothetical protein
MAKTVQPHRAQAGDLVTTAARRVGESGRTGEILEVLGDPGHEHYRVRWEDEHESVFYPGGDAVIRPKRPHRVATREKKS